jgi:hypothetical protein
MKIYFDVKHIHVQEPVEDLKSKLLSVSTNMITTEIVSKPDILLQIYEMLKKQQIETKQLFSMSDCEEIFKNTDGLKITEPNNHTSEDYQKYLSECYLDYLDKKKHSDFSFLERFMNIFDDDIAGWIAKNLENDEYIRNFENINELRNRYIFNKYECGAKYPYPQNSFISMKTGDIISKGGSVIRNVVAENINNMLALQKKINESPRIDEDTRNNCDVIIRSVNDKYNNVKATSFKPSDLDFDIYLNLNTSWIQDNSKRVKLNENMTINLLPNYIKIKKFARDYVWKLSSNIRSNSQFIIDKVDLCINHTDMLSKYWTEYEKELTNYVRSETNSREESILKKLLAKNVSFKRHEDETIKLVGIYINRKVFNKDKDILIDINTNNTCSMWKLLNILDPSAVNDNIRDMEDGDSYEEPICQEPFHSDDFRIDPVHYIPEENKYKLLTLLDDTAYQMYEYELKHLENMGPTNLYGVDIEKNEHNYNYNYNLSDVLTVDKYKIETVTRECNPIYISANNTLCIESDKYQSFNLNRLKYDIKLIIELNDIVGTYKYLIIKAPGELFDFSYSNKSSLTKKNNIKNLKTLFNQENNTDIEYEQFLEYYLYGFMNIQNEGRNVITKRYSDLLLLFELEKQLSNDFVYTGRIRKLDKLIDRLFMFYLLYIINGNVNVNFYIDDIKWKTIEKILRLDTDYMETDSGKDVFHLFKRLDSMQPPYDLKKLSNYLEASCAQVFNNEIHNEFFRTIAINKCINIGLIQKNVENISIIKKYEDTTNAYLVLLKEPLKYKEYMQNYKKHGGMNKNEEEKYKKKYLKYKKKYMKLRSLEHK